MQDAYPFEELEESIWAIEGLMKLIGEAYQGVVEADDRESIAAAGILVLRRGAIERLHSNYKAAHAEYQRLRRESEQRKAR